MTNMRKLKSAAHAAGFAMAPSEDLYKPEDEPLPAQAIEDAWRGDPAHPKYVPGTALAVRVPEAASAWFRDWFAVFGFGRAPA